MEYFFIYLYFVLFVVSFVLSVIELLRGHWERLEVIAPTTLLLMIAFLGNLYGIAPG